MEKKSFKFELCIFHEISAILHFHPHRVIYIAPKST